MNRRSLFSEPDIAGVAALPGYRLQRLELFNWGTFDSTGGQVYSVTPQGQTTLLVGRNGCGKSTLVDALLTLLVRPSIRNFNVAAGAGKRERDERTYVKGAYDRGGDDDVSSGQLRFLRPRGSHYSVILAVFSSQGSGRSFTVAQVLYLTADQSVEKIYCMSEGERCIRDDFGGFEGTDSLVRLLKQRGFKASRTFADFEGWLTKATNLRSKAMEVFNQTVAVKDIQRLNDFIRNHMLEQANRGERVDRLLSHFTQLCEAHQSLVRVRQQAELLEPISGIGEDCRRRQLELRRVERRSAAISAFFQDTTVRVIEPILKNRQRQSLEVQQQLQRLDQQRIELNEQARSLQSDIEQAGGERLRTIPLLIDTAEAKAQQLRADRQRFEDVLQRSRMGISVDSPDQFQSFREQLTSVQHAAVQQEEQLRARQVDLAVDRRKLRQSIQEGETELEGLNRRRDNIPEWCVELRSQVCRDLGLNIVDLPFVAELIAVHPDEREWEASIEKVLNSFALSLLVPERLYASVSRYVDRTRLVAQGRGQRLIYLQVGAPALSLSGPVPAADSMLNKLVYRDNQPLLPWVRAELQQRFDYRCCDSIEEFQQCRGAAMTAARHTKNNQRRHDKDDRDKVADPRNFVLGWDNRQKKQRIAAELESLREQEQVLSTRAGRIQAELAEISDRTQALKSLLQFTVFEQIDPAPLERQIADLRQEREQLESRSDVIQLLRQRLAEVEAQRKAAECSRDQAVQQLALLQRDITDGERLLLNARSALQKRTSEGLLDEDRSYFDELQEWVADPPLDEQELVSGQRERQLQQSHQRDIEAKRSQLAPVQSELIRLMTRFLQKFPDERQDLNPGLEYLDSFLGLRQRIIEEDLPRHEQRFRERLNEKVIHEIGLFRAELETERREIEDRIEVLNASLKQLEYRPGTHIQLEPRPVRDREVVEFQTRLRECIESSFDDSAAANEARFERIRELVEKLRDETNRRWRDKVTDVRRWFDFVAAVIDRETMQTVSVYQDSSGQSGGEKAKLAFTILVAAIAYQYDIDPDRPAPDRFHFVVVDEMFSRVDDQHAEYAMDLFRQFGLQLLIVAPLDAKARITQPYVGSYLHVNKRDNRSEIFEMTAQEFSDVMGEPATPVADASPGMNPSISS